MQITKKNKFWIIIYSLSSLFCIFFIVLSILFLSNPTLWRDLCDQPFNSVIETVQNDTIVVFVPELNVTTSILFKNSRQNLTENSFENSFEIGESVQIYKDCNLEKIFYLNDVPRKIDSAPWIITLIAAILCLITFICLIYARFTFCNWHTNIP
jgi:hypothetical protein